MIAVTSSSPHNSTSVQDHRCRPLQQQQHELERQALQSYHQRFNSHQQGSEQLSWLPHRTHNPADIFRRLSIRSTTPLATFRTPGVTFNTFIKELFTAIFVFFLLMASCCDARVFSGSKIITSNGPHRRLIRSLQTSTSGNSSILPPHSTKDMFSVNPRSSNSSSISSKEDIPNEFIPLRSHSTHERSVGSNPKSESRSELIALLISTLGKLHVLNNTNISCFQLDKIIIKNNEDTQSSSTSSKTEQWSASTFTVHLQFQEIFQQTSSSSSALSSDAAAYNAAAGNTGSDSSSVLLGVCASNPIVEVVESSINIATNENADFTNETLYLNKESSTAAASDILTSQTGRLSLTQIVVISTCSAVIGMCFLIAGFLRIRNYIKRSRLEQELARRPKFRSCSVALRGTTQSMEQLRRDSLASKTSHQNSLTTQASNSSHTNGSFRENSATTPRHEPDTAPLLLTGNSLMLNSPSTPTESHASLKYIDEDVATPKKKVIPLATFNRNEKPEKYGYEGISQGQLTDTLAEVTSLKGRPNSSPSNGRTLQTPNENGQMTSEKIEGNINPSFSSGSISYHLSGGVDPQKAVTGGGAVNSVNADENEEKTEKSVKELNQLCNMDTEKEKMISLTNVQSNNESEKPEFSGILQVSDADELKRVVGNGVSFINNGSQETPRNTNSPAEKTCPAPAISSADSACPQNTSSFAENASSPYTNASAEIAFSSSDADNNVNKTPNNEDTFEKNCLKNDHPDVTAAYPDLSHGSGFGLAQSDTSLESVTNQGKEFFGQAEYRGPGDRGLWEISNERQSDGNPGKENYSLETAMCTDCNVANGAISMTMSKPSLEAENHLLPNLEHIVPGD